jgi:hypothetical protein
VWGCARCSLSCRRSRGRKGILSLGMCLESRRRGGCSSAKLSCQRDSRRVVFGLRYGERRGKKNLVVSHAMATPRRWAFSFRFNAGPFPCPRIKAPEIIIMIKSTLFRTRKLAYPPQNPLAPSPHQVKYAVHGSALTAKQPHPSRIPAPTPRMSTPRQRTIRTRHRPPLIPIDEVNAQIVEKPRRGPVKELPAKQKYLVGVTRGSQQGRGRARGRRRLEREFGYFEVERLLSRFSLDL